MTNIKKILARRKRIEKIKIDQLWMWRNLEGCDWCCGGGIERMQKLSAELLLLEHSKGKLTPCLQNPYVDWCLTVHWDYGAPEEMLWNFRNRLVDYIAVPTEQRARYLVNLAEKILKHYAKVE